MQLITARLNSGAKLLMAEKRDEKSDMRILGFTLTLMLCSVSAFKAQLEPPLAIRIRQAIEKKEPGWQLIVAVESGLVRLVPSQKRILVGSWEHRLHGGKNQMILTRVYEVENSVEAKKWLGPVINGQVASDWRVYKYSIGDEGYLSKYLDGKQFEIQLRKRNVVAAISGQDLRVVKRFAKYIVSQIPPSNNSFNQGAKSAALMENLDDFEVVSAPG